MYIYISSNPDLFLTVNDDSEESDAPRRKKTRKLWSESDSESDDSTWGRRKKK